MAHRFLDIVATPGVKAAQAANGSRRSYARLEGGEATHDRLGRAEAAFIEARDSFYLASVGETGWPYIQHRGGPPGFLKVLGKRQLGFADFRGNRQYVSLGNIKGENRVALFLMDYPNRRRLKLLGRMTAVDLHGDAALAERLLGENCGAMAERGFTVTVEAFDWNCPQHITPRFSEGELEQALQPTRRRIEQLEVENRALKAELERIRQENVP